ncbi:L-aspartate oxidase [Aliidongia dinghuensis]|uniref:L-aspartate oxidase n=1 Tax=Aliidongia dinghuensis TaxID=1867774 RepID=A0A8J3E497_9PROT|nr:L-aspartate oxidase [Aliidongia dinghuensis]GGF22269.1 L-aspartate oxidase [Aliidongia dinghuensis]
MTLNLNELAGRPVIVGAGLAGLVAALALAPRPVVVVTKATLGAGAASGWAQGGVAAAVLPGDAPALHAADTIAAGAGLCDPAMVEHVTGAAPAAIEVLLRYGVPFDRDVEGRLLASLEAAHGRPRVLHVGGDTSGREIMAAVVAAVRATPSITVLEATAVHRLIADGRMLGVALAGDGESGVLPTGRVLLATGGLGGLWRHTTNPPGAVGQGPALAAEAGLPLVDLEFMQFHPTAIDVGADPMPLASEALRGDGAVLIDEAGRRFMAGVPRQELAPRDVVARAVWAELEAGRQVFLDGRQAIGARFPDRFPAVTAVCRAAGIDPVTMPIPVRPAAHYHMGGIPTDVHGRTALAGLWAAGECASTGLHGANRLASNSLLEAVVMGEAAARDMSGYEAADAEGNLPVPSTRPADPDGLAEIRRILGAHVGVRRDATGLTRAIAALAPLAARPTAAAGPALVALMMAVAALDRPESRGSHYRADHPHPVAALALSRPLDAAEALRRLQSLREEGFAA